MTENKKSKVSDTNTEFFFIIFLVLLVLPFVILHLFNNPDPEDLNWVVERTSHGFINAQFYFYEFWGGRFFVHAVLSLCSFFYEKSFIAYKAITLSLLLIFFYSLYYLISKVTDNSLKAGEKLLFSLTIFFLYLYSMPSILEGIYWLESVICYLLSSILITTFFIFLIRLKDAEKFRENFWYTLICCLLVISISGMNEIGAVLILMLMFILIAANSLNTRKINPSLVIVAMVMMTGVYISFSAPTNDFRMQILEANEFYMGKHQFFFSIFNSFIFLIEKVFAWTFNSPLLILSLILIPLFFKVVNQRGKNTGIFLMKPVYSLTLSFIFLYTSIFMIIFGVGMFPYDRILNFIYFVFLVCWFWNLIVLIFYISTKYKINPERLPKYSYAVAVLIIGIFLVKENNVRTAYTELLNGAAYRYDKEVNERHRFILESSPDSIKVKSIKNQPKTLFASDISNEVFFINKNYARFYNKKSIVVEEPRP